MKLEEKIAKLDEFATAIEQKDVTLEDALDIFEQSVKLASECFETLNDCSGKLTVLSEQVKRLTDEE